MGMGFAPTWLPTWLRQVSPPASHDHFSHWLTFCPIDDSLEGEVTATATTTTDAVIVI